MSEVAFHKMGEVVFGTVMKLRALISLNLEGYTPISYKSGKSGSFVMFKASFLLKKGWGGVDTPG